MKRSAIGPIVMALAIATASVVTFAQAADSKAFVNDLTIAGMAEVQLGKLATERAANPDVKAFGQMMVKDHTQAGNELKPIAAQLNIPQPTQLDQQFQQYLGPGTILGSIMGQPTTQQPGGAVPGPLRAIERVRS